MIEPDAVEAVLEREHTLDLVRLDHRGEHVFYGELLAVPRQPVSGPEYPAEVVRRMAPFGGEPGVVEVEPTDHGAEVERRLHRIELVMGAGYLRAIRHHRA